MTRTATIIAIGLVLAAGLSAVPALAAGAARTYVSTAGSDGNNCANVASPCRHFQNAYNATAPGGEIVALDPGNYGSITSVTHGVTINGQGWAYVAPPSGGAGFTINASASDSVTINGVVLDGVGVPGATNGIVFNSGGSLTITNCRAQNFAGTLTAGNGILIQPTSGTVTFTITDTVASNNGESGINYRPPGGSPSAIGAIYRITANANFSGIEFFTGHLASNSASAIFNVSNSLVSGNQVDGVFIDTGTNSSVLKVSLDNVTVVGNGDIGVEIDGNTFGVIGRSTVTGNATGVFWTSNTLLSYGNNQVNQNVNDFSPSAPPGIPTR